MRSCQLRSYQEFSKHFYGTGKLITVFTGPYPELDQSGPYNPVSFSKIHLSIILPRPYVQTLFLKNKLLSYFPYLENKIRFMRSPCCLFSPFENISPPVSYVVRVALKENGLLILIRIVILSCHPRTMAYR